ILDRRLAAAVALDRQDLLDRRVGQRPLGIAQRPHDELRLQFARGNRRAERPGTAPGIKEFSDWPTVPQLYVKGEFVGGADIVHGMHESGQRAGGLAARNMATATAPV